MLIIEYAWNSPCSWNTRNQKHKARSCAAGFVRSTQITVFKARASEEPKVRLWCKSLLSAPIYLYIPSEPRAGISWSLLDGIFHSLTYARGHDISRIFCLHQGNHEVQTCLICLVCAALWKWIMNRPKHLKSLEHKWITYTSSFYVLQYCTV